MPSVYSTSSDDVSAAAASYDHINDFLLTESQVQTSQDVHIYFSPEVVKKAPHLETFCSEEDEEESVVFLATNCKERDANCSISNEEYKAMLRLGTGKKENDTEPPTATSFIVHKEEGSKMLLSEGNKASDECVKNLLEEKELLAAALDAAKKEVLVLTNYKLFVRNLLKLSDPDLKALCNSNKIKLRGQAKNKRNNYIVKLLEHMYDERSNPL